MLRRVKLAAQHGQHIHARVRLALEQDRNIVAVHFDANRFVERDGIRLMGGLLQHGGEPEKLPLRRFIDHNFLMIFVDGRDTDHPRHQHVGLSARVADFPDSLSGPERLHLNLSSEYRGFVVVE
jgi:hypothetical protein